MFDLICGTLLLYLVLAEVNKRIKITFKNLLLGCFGCAMVMSLYILACAIADVI